MDRPGVGSAGIAAGYTYQQVIEAVAVYVAAAGYAEARIVVCGASLDLEPHARSQTSQVDRSKAGFLTEDDIGLARGRAAVVTKRRRNDNVVEAVAIDVARAGDAVACKVVATLTLDLEPCGRCQVRQIDRSKAGGLAENHIGFAGIGTAIVAKRRADDDVIETI